MHELTNAQSHSELPKDFHLKQPGQGRSVLKAGDGNSYDATSSLPFETAANAKEATESYGAYRPPDASIGVSTRFPREILNVAGLSVKVSKLVAHEALGGSPLRGV
jgi:hypothetical protein